jgi:hypothetical protein
MQQELYSVDQVADLLIEVSGIVEIDAISPDAASRVSNGMLGAAKGRSQEDDPPRIETTYSEERARLKIAPLGSIGTVGSFLRIITALLES